MKAFVFAALVAYAAAAPGGVTADNADLQTEENVVIDSTATEVEDVAPIVEPVDLDDY